MITFCPHDIRYAEEHFLNIHQSEWVFLQKATFHQEWSRDLCFISGLPMLLALIAIGVQIDLKNPDDV